MSIINESMSNKSVDWASQYDYYQTQLREEIYRTSAKPQNDSHFEMIKHRLKSYLNKSKVFAEIGFGAGITLRYASKYFDTVYGLDISPLNIKITNEELLKEGYANVELYCTDIMTKDKRFKNAFDVISMIHGLEHFSNDDYPILFDNIKTYLKDGGAFTGALPYDLPFNYRMCPECCHVFEIDGHLSRHNLKSIEELFKVNNFRLIHLNNFNMHFYKKNSGLIKTFYNIFQNIVNKRRKQSGQIEFIAQVI